jgi:methanethiol S-methyltransferase
MERIFMSKRLAFGFGIASYVFFLAVFLYAIGFVGNLVVPKSIDSGATGTLMTSLMIDYLLLGIFAIQHSGMARPGFKRWWMKVIPRPIERSTYVLLANLALVVLYWQWRPLPGVVWDISAAWGQWLLWSLFILGWLIVLTATFMINHWHLFGLQQVSEDLQGKTLSEPKFMTPGYYRFIRHPIMAGFLIAFWATPHMSIGHLVFALAVTAYILVAVQLEQRDLTRMFGERYRAYMQRVPAFFPRVVGGGRSRSGHTQEV